MLPPRKKRNSSKVNLTISLVFHGLIIAALFFFAAREGMLGKQLKKIAVTMAPKEKPPEKPKEKPPEEKIEPPKTETPKVAANRPPPPVAAPSPAAASAPVAAPPPAALPAFDFSDGAKVVQTSTDPNVLYKGLVEYAIRSRWLRPEDIQDENYVAEVEVQIDRSGKLLGNEWKKSSGDRRWDDTVKHALAATKAISRPPPKSFPERVLVRFDVQQHTEPIIQTGRR